MILADYKPNGSSLDSFDLVDVTLGVWVSAGVLRYGTGDGLMGSLLQLVALIFTLRRKKREVLLAQILLMC